MSDTPKTGVGSHGDVRQFTVSAEDDGIRLDRWFKRHLEATSYTTVAKWARTGQLRIDGARATPGDRLAAGQVLRVPPAEPVRTDAPKAAARARTPLTPDEEAFIQELVIHKDSQAIVINKPHKDTSGALLVARNARAAGHFAKAFSSRTARKVYWALIVGVPDIFDGMIELPIGKQPGSGGEKMHVDEENGSPARTRYRVIERAGNRAAWVELQPFTGRTHQLRVHLNAIGHPIVGDGKYGGAASFLTGGVSRKMHLHARRIRIDHPDGGQIDVTAELPAHFAESLKLLGFDEKLGNAMPMDEVKFSETAEGKRRAAAAIAKSRRQERKGERRGRQRS
ncbi:RluA family pseudouridine synthase [Sphingomonas sp. 32-62-10]|uniref:RluA family pseudouridine synthase n=1 Tax=Sphingomonas sp. 32-62-10 TaxID=1970436 RepID=UPI000BD5D306|nr:MAG: RNA pseudouridine synthase [Sphingomonas sp. 32-62-10]